MLDDTYFHLINQVWISPELDRLMPILSSYKLWVPLVILLVLITLIFGGAKGRAILVAGGIALGINDGLCTQFGKKLFNRSRPNEAVAGARTVSLDLKSAQGFGITSPIEISIKSPDDELKPWGGRSFPSGHVTNNITIGIVLVYFLGPWAWCYFVFALGVSYSRIYVASHWPTDVMLSIVTATLLTFTVLAALRFAWLRWAPRLLPTLVAAHPQLFPPLLTFSRR